MQNGLFERVIDENGSLVRRLKRVRAKPKVKEEAEIVSRTDKEKIRGKLNGRGIFRYLFIFEIEGENFGVEISHYPKERQRFKITPNREVLRKAKLVTGNEKLQIDQVRMGLMERKIWDPKGKLVCWMKF